MEEAYLDIRVYHLAFVLAVDIVVHLDSIFYAATDEATVAGAL